MNYNFLKMNLRIKNLLKFNQKSPKSSFWVNGYSLTEILIVLCIIGILIMMVLPNQTSVIGQAKAIEAKNALNQIHQLQKNFFYMNNRYAKTLEELKFEQPLLTEQGGQAIYRIEITQASTSAFVVKAVSTMDFDGDGQLNTWEINEKRKLVETIVD